MDYLGPERNDASESVARDHTRHTRVKGPPKESERWLRSVVQNASDIIAVLDAEGTIGYVSLAVERILGYKPESMIGTLALDYVHPEDVEWVSKSLAEALEKPGALRSPVVFKARAKDGSWRHMEVILRNLLDDPNVQGVVVNARDTTGWVEAEERLKESEERFKAQYKGFPIPTYSWRKTDGDFVLVDHNDAAYEITQGHIVDFLGVRASEMYSDKPEVLRMLSQCFEERATVRQEMAWTMNTTGERKHFMVSFIFVPPDLVMVHTDDVTERKRMEEQLRHQAFHDRLTDLPNRSLFVYRLAQALKRTERRGLSETAVLCMDLDNFKVVNDSLGYEVGDRLLILVAERLKGCLRPEDTLARFGGKEFGVLLEDVDNPDAAKVAERIVEELRRPFVLDGRELFVNVSIGIALDTTPQKRPDELLRSADTAMNEAKEEGSDYQVFDPDMYERAVQRLVLENDLRRAIEAEEFVIHYQPIVDLQTGKTWGVEALVRWEHPQKGMLGPSEFVPVAEERGLVIPMGEQVLKEACLQAAK